MTRCYLTKEEAAPFLKPFDESDENDVRADIFRKIIFDRAARALKKGGTDEYMSFLAGTFVGLAEVILKNGATPDQTWKALTAMIAFAIAQASDGEFVPTDLVVEEAKPKGTA